jgi:nucleoid DNA-binding protein
MEKRFTPVKAKKPYYFALDLVKQKTNLQDYEAILVFDIFIFYIRKYLVLNRTLEFITLGKFKLIFFKRKRNFLKFTAFETLRRVINNKKDHKFDKRKFQYFRYAQSNSDFTKIIKSISEILRIERKQVAFLINILIYSLIEELLKNKVVKVRFFAYFYVTKYKFTRLTAFGLNLPILASDMVKIDAISNFKKEINGKSPNFKIPIRLKRIFSRLNISNEIKLSDFL